MPKLRLATKPQNPTTPEPHENIEQTQSSDELFEVAAPESEAETLESVAAAKEIKPVVKNESAQKTQDATSSDSALQRQIEALRKSESLARQREEEARQRAAERERDVSRFQKETTQLKTDLIAKAIAAANSDATVAQNEIEAAISIADVKAQAEAYRKLAKAESALARLEEGAAAIKELIETTVEAPRAQTEDPLERSQIPQIAKNWLRSHPEYYTDPRKNAKIQALHWDVIDEGYAAWSPGYFESIERHLGLRDAEPQPQTEQPQQRNSIVSAPVSREVPTGKLNQRSGRVTLTKDQVEAAKMSNITEAEYAKQLQIFNERKANGLIQP